MAATVLVHLRVQKIAHTQNFVGTERVSERKNLQQMTAEWSRETEFPKFSLYPYQFTVQLQNCFGIALACNTECIFLGVNWS